jgi:hypothetical protein
MLKSLLTVMQKSYTRRALVVFLVVAVVMILFPEHIYAQSSITGEAKKDAFLILSNIINLMSWLWIIPASLA